MVVDKLNKNVRFEWIDVLKAFGIYLVVVGHVIDDCAFKQFIYSFHMPLFYILSGLLYKFRPFRQSLLNCFKTLIIPYFIINTVCLCYFSLNHYLIDHDFTFGVFKSMVLAIVCGVSIKSDTFYPVSAPTWFLLTLVVIKLLLSLSKDRRGVIMVITAISMIIAFVLSKFSIETYFPLDSAFLALPFFTVPYLFKSIFLQDIPRKYMFVSVLGIVWGGVIDIFNGPVDMNMMNVGQSIILYYLSAFIIGFSLILLCNSLKVGSGRFVNLLSLGSIIILGFHGIAMRLVTHYLQILIPTIEYHTLQSLGVSALIVLLIVPIILFSKKYFQPLLGYRK